jgi:hypothetical protein
MVTGSHAIGGLSKFSSPDLTSCRFVPFDCTPVGQISAAPFDNNMFKVACDGVRGVSKGACQFNTVCSNPIVEEAGCPFRGDARAAFQACNATSYPTPGLISGECSANSHSVCVCERCCICKSGLTCCIKCLHCLLDSLGWCPQPHGVVQPWACVMYVGQQTVYVQRASMLHKAAYCVCQQLQLPLGAILTKQPADDHGFPRIILA